MFQIDLNADIGESFGRWKLGDDEALCESISSANIACGFHAGDPATLLTTVGSAVSHGVAIGAQVGYHDLPGFGRRFIDMNPDDLTAEVIYQMGALEGLARSRGGRVEYVKPHGALYNAIFRHRGQAAAVVRAVLEFDASLPVLGLPGSAFLELAADAGLRTVAEAFADRAYTPDGSLMPRGEPGAVLHDPAVIAARMARLAIDRSIEASDGSRLTVVADSICVHGDTPGAVEIASAVRASLAAHDVAVQSFR